MQRNLKLFISLLSLTGISFVGCYKDKEELLYPDSVNCGSSLEVSYSNHVVPIVLSNCYSCHGSSVYSTSGGSINLEGHGNILVVAQNGLLVKSIRHSAGASPMPKNRSALSSCDVSTIENWVNQGIKNN